MTLSGRVPCQLCPHVVIEVGLVCFNDLWSYAVEPIMPDGSKVRLQTKRDTRGRTVWVRFRDASVHQTCLCEQTSDGVTPEQDPTSLQKAKLESATREGPDVGPTICQSRGNRSNELPWTWRRRQLKKRAGFLVSRRSVPHSD